MPVVRDEEVKGVEAEEEKRTSNSKGPLKVFWMKWTLPGPGSGLRV